MDGALTEREALESRRQVGVSQFLMSWYSLVPLMKDISNEICLKYHSAPRAQGAVATHACHKLTETGGSGVLGKLELPIKF